MRPTFLRPRPRTGPDTVLHLKLYDGLMTTGKVFDYSLSGTAGTLVDTDTPITLVPTYPGFDFDGANDYIDAGRKSVPTGNFSISQWFKCGAVVAATYYVLFSQYKLADAGRLVIAQRGGYMFSRFGDVAGASVTTALGTTDWHHIVVIRNGTSLKVILNGNYASPEIDDVIGADDCVQDGNNAYIGTDGTYPFNGKIDETMVFSKVLTNLESFDIYNLTKWRYGK